MLAVCQHWFDSFHLTHIAHVLKHPHRSRMTSYTSRSRAALHRLYLYTYSHISFLVNAHTHTHTCIESKPWWLGLFLSDWKCSVCNSSSVLHKQRERITPAPFLPFLSLSIYFLQLFYSSYFHCIFLHQQWLFPIFRPEPGKGKVAEFYLKCHAVSLI